jgi:hypothetical protein
MIDKKGTKQRERIIIILIVLGILCLTLQYYYRQDIDKKQKKYWNEQKEVTTCDLEYVLKYKNLYMGNASNIMQLFHSLPLSAAIKDFQLFSDKLTAQVNFIDSKLNAGKISIDSKSSSLEGISGVSNTEYQNEVNKSLLYNSIAAFALIDNLEGILYHFTDITYTVTREDIETTYGDLDSLLKKDTWEKVVRNPLGDKEYVTVLSEKFLKSN